jgi:putative membrane protein
MIPAIGQDPLRKKVRRLDTLAWILTIIIWLLVGAMRRYKFDVPFDLSWLAGLNAFFNTGVTIALIVAYRHIRRKRIEQHKRSIYVAMILSAGFLLSYVGYHFTNEEVAFCGEGVWKYIYYIILFSHIILAGLSLPFILLTFIRGYVRDDLRHRKLAKKVYPVWLYVAITGPIVYLFLISCR